MTTYTGFRRTTRRDDPKERLWVYGRARLPCRRCGTSISVKETRGLTRGSRIGAPRVSYRRSAGLYLGLPDSARKQG